MITKDEILDLFNATMQDFPWPSAADMIAGFSVESDFDVKECLKFMRKHYTLDEINAGFEEHYKRLEWCLKLFGSKNETEKSNE